MAIMPFQVIRGHDFGTNQKPIYDFLLVINTNLHPISHRFQVLHNIGQIFAFDIGATFL